MKRLYDILALLAILHVVVLLGVLGYAVGTGKLTAERVEQIADILAGPDPNAALADAAGEPAPEPVAAPSATASTQKVQQDAEAQARRMLKLDRLSREIQNQQSLVQLAQLQLAGDRDDLEDEIDTFNAMRQAWQHQQNNDGFMRSLEYISGIEASLAKQLLKAKKDVDVARFLSEMDDRKGRAIIEECTSPEDQAWISKILQMIEQGSSSPAEPVDTSVAMNQ